MFNVLTPNGKFNITNSLYENIKVNNPELLLENDPSKSKFFIRDAYEDATGLTYNPNGDEFNALAILLDKSNNDPSEFIKKLKNVFEKSDNNEENFKKNLGLILKNKEIKDYTKNKKENNKTLLHQNKKNDEINNNIKNDSNELNNSNNSLIMLIGDYHEKIQNEIKNDNIENSMDVADEIYKKFRKAINSKVKEIIDNGRSDNLTDEDKKYIKSKYIFVINNFYNNQNDDVNNEDDNDNDNDNDNDIQNDDIEIMNDSIQELSNDFNTELSGEWTMDEKTFLSYIYSVYNTIFNNDKENLNIVMKRFKETYKNYTKWLKNKKSDGLKIIFNKVIKEIDEFKDKIKELEKNKILSESIIKEDEMTSKEKRKQEFLNINNTDKNINKVSLKKLLKGFASGGIENVDKIISQSKFWNGSVSDIDKNNQMKIQARISEFSERHINDITINMLRKICQKHIDDDENSFFFKQFLKALDGIGLESLNKNESKSYNNEKKIYEDTNDNTNENNSIKQEMENNKKAIPFKKLILGLYNIDDEEKSEKLYNELYSDNDKEKTDAIEKISKVKNFFTYITDSEYESLMRATVDPIKGKDENERIDNAEKLILHDKKLIEKYTFDSDIPDYILNYYAKIQKEVKPRLFGSNIQIKFSNFGQGNIKFMFEEPKQTYIDYSKNDGTISVDTGIKICDIYRKLIPASEFWKNVAIVDCRSEKAFNLTTAAINYNSQRDEINIKQKQVVTGLDTRTIMYTITDTKDYNNKNIFKILNRNKSAKLFDKNKDELKYNDDIKLKKIKRRYFIIVTEGLFKKGKLFKNVFNAISNGIGNKNFLRNDKALRY